MWCQVERWSLSLSKLQTPDGVTGTQFILMESLVSVNSMSKPNYSKMTDGQFWSLVEQGQTNTDPSFYEEFQRRTAQGRHYNPNLDPQAWEKSTADLIAFMDKAGLPH
jgi:hypothetical protein